MGIGVRVPSLGNRERIFCELGHFGVEFNGGAFLVFYPISRN